MKTIFCILICLSTTTIIKLNYYCGEGVIFSKEHRNTSLSYSDIPFTPSLNQVKRAEKIMHENYYDFQVKWFDSLNVQSKLDVINNKPATFIKHFRKYNRQYTGYCDESKDSIIYIGLLNFSNKKKSELYFSSWKEMIVFGAGEFYEKNFRFCKINLTKEKIVSN